MTEPDIIAQAEALIEEVRKIREDEPRIEIHASELSALERKALIRAADLAKRYEELMPHLLAEAKAWKVTAIEERARSVAFGDRKEFWEQLSEEFAGYCILEATKMLAEETRSEAKGDE